MWNGRFIFNSEPKAVMLVTPDTMLHQNEVHGGAAERGNGSLVNTSQDIMYRGPFSPNIPILNPTQPFKAFPEIVSTSGKEADRQGVGVYNSASRMGDRMAVSRGVFRKAIQPEEENQEAASRKKDGEPQRASLISPFHPWSPRGRAPSSSRRGRT